MALTPEEAIEITDQDKAAADTTERLIDTKLATRRTPSTVIAIGVVPFPVRAELSRRYLAAGWKAVDFLDLPGGAAEIKLTG